MKCIVEKTSSNVFGDPCLTFFFMLHLNQIFHLYMRNMYDIDWQHTCFPLDNLFSIFGTPPAPFKWRLRTKWRTFHQKLLFVLPFILMSIQLLGYYFLWFFFSYSCTYFFVFVSPASILQNILKDIQFPKMKESSQMNTFIIISVSLLITCSRW